MIEICLKNKLRLFLSTIHSELFLFFLSVCFPSSHPSLLPSFFGYIRRKKERERKEEKTERERERKEGKKERMKGERERKEKTKFWLQGLAPACGGSQPGLPSLMHVCRLVIAAQC